MSAALHSDSQRFQLETLEPRVLLSGDGLPPADSSSSGFAGVDPEFFERTSDVVIADPADSASSAFGFNSQSAVDDIFEGVETTSLDLGGEEASTVQTDQPKQPEQPEQPEQSSDVEVPIHALSVSSGAAANGLPPSVDLDGVDDYVTVPSASMDFSQGLTIESWVNFDTLSAYSKIIDLGDNTIPGRMGLFVHGSDNRLILELGIGGSYESLEVTNVLSTGEWMHLAGTVDTSGTARIYVNGDEVASGPMSLPATATRQGYIGANFGGGLHFLDGKIDELRLWNVTRSQAEIQANMNAEIEPAANLIGYWRFDEGSGTSASDSSGNGMTGTLQNGAGWLIHDPAGADSSVTFDEDTSRTFAPEDFTFSDLDGHTFGGIQLISLPAAGVLKNNSESASANDVISDVTTLTFAPVANANSSPYTTFEFRVRDSSGAISAATYTMTVNVTPVNDAPTGSDGSVTLDEDGSRTFASDDFTFADVDGDTFGGIQIVTLPGTGTLTNGETAVAAEDVITGVTTLVFTPPADVSGSPYATFTFKVRDSTGTLSDATYTMTMNVTAVNDAPTIGVIADPDPIAEDAGQQMVVFSGIADGDNSGQTLTITAASDNEALTGIITVNYTPGESAGSLTFTPVEGASGSATITVTVRDDGGIGHGGQDTASVSFVVVVNELNTAPVFTSTPSQIIPAGSEYRYTINFEDPDADDSPVLSVMSKPSWLTFDEASLTLSGIPSTDDIGSAEVILQVDDGAVVVTQTFTIDVTAAALTLDVGGIFRLTANELQSPTGENESGAVAFSTDAILEFLKLPLFGPLALARVDLFSDGTGIDAFEIADLTASISGAIQSASGIFVQFQGLALSLVGVSKRNNQVSGEIQFTATGGTMFPGESGKFSAVIQDGGDEGTALSGGIDTGSGLVAFVAERTVLSVGTALELGASDLQFTVDPSADASLVTASTTAASAKAPDLPGLPESTSGSLEIRRNGFTVGDMVFGPGNSLMNDVLSLEGVRLTVSGHGFEEERGFEGSIQLSADSAALLANSAVTASATQISGTYTLSEGANSIQLTAGTFEASAAGKIRVTATSATLSPMGDVIFASQSVTGQLPALGLSGTVQGLQIGRTGTFSVTGFAVDLSGGPLELGLANMLPFSVTTVAVAYLGDTNGNGFVDDGEQFRLDEFDLTVGGSFKFTLLSALPFEPIIQVGGEGSTQSFDDASDTFEFTLRFVDGGFQPWDIGPITLGVRNLAVGRLTFGGSITLGGYQEGRFVTEFGGTISIESGLDQIQGSAAVAVTGSFDPATQTIDLHSVFTVSATLQNGLIELNTGVIDFSMSVTAGDNFQLTASPQLNSASIGHLVVRFGRFVTFEAANVTVNFKATGAEAFVSFGSVATPDDPDGVIGGLAVHFGDPDGSSVFDGWGGSAGNFAIGADLSFILLDGFFVKLEVGNTRFGLPSFLPIRIREVGIKFNDDAVENGKLVDPANFNLVLSGGVEASSVWPIEGRVDGLEIDIQKFARGEFPIVNLSGVSIGVKELELGPVVIGGGLSLGVVTVNVNGQDESAFYARLNGEFSYSGIGGGIDIAFSEYGPLLATVTAGGLTEPNTGFVFGIEDGGFIFGGPGLPSVERPLDLLTKPEFQLTEAITVDTIRERVQQSIQRGTYTWEESFTLTVTGTVTNLYVQGMIDGRLTLAANVSIVGPDPGLKLLGKGDIKILGIPFVDAAVMLDFSNPLAPQYDWAFKLPSPNNPLGFLFPIEAELEASLDTSGIIEMPVIGFATFLGRLAAGTLDVGQELSRQALTEVAAELEAAHSSPLAKILLDIDGDGVVSAEEDSRLIDYDFFLSRALGDAQGEVPAILVSAYDEYAVLSPERVAQAVAFIHEVIPVFLRKVQSIDGSDLNQAGLLMVPVIQEAALAGLRAGWDRFHPEFRLRGLIQPVIFGIPMGSPLLKADLIINKDKITFGFDGSIRTVLGMMLSSGQINLGQLPPWIAGLTDTTTFDFSLDLPDELVEVVISGGSRGIDGVVEDLSAYLIRAINPYSNWDIGLTSEFTFNGIKIGAISGLITAPQPQNENGEFVPGGLFKKRVVNLDPDGDGKPNADLVASVVNGGETLVPVNSLEQYENMMRFGGFIATGQLFLPDLLRDPVATVTGMDWTPPQLNVENPFDVPGAVQEVREYLDRLEAALTHSTEWARMQFFMPSPAALFDMGDYLKVDATSPKFVEVDLAKLGAGKLETFQQMLQAAFLEGYGELRLFGLDAGEAKVDATVNGFAAEVEVPFLSGFLARYEIGKRPVNANQTIYELVQSPLLSLPLSAAGIGNDVQRLFSFLVHPDAPQLEFELPIASFLGEFDTARAAQWLQDQFGLPPEFVSVATDGTVNARGTYRAFTPGYGGAGAEALQRNGGYQLALHLNLAGLVENANFLIEFQPFSALSNTDLATLLIPNFKAIASVDRLHLPGLAPDSPLFRTENFLVQIIKDASGLRLDLDGDVSFLGGQFTADGNLNLNETGLYGALLLTADSSQSAVGEFLGIGLDGVCSVELNASSTAKTITRTTRGGPVEVQIDPGYRVFIDGKLRVGGIEIDGTQLFSVDGAGLRAEVNGTTAVGVLGAEFFRFNVAGGLTIDSKGIAGSLLATQTASLVPELVFDASRTLLLQVNTTGEARVLGGNSLPASVNGSTIWARVHATGRLALFGFNVDGLFDLTIAAASVSVQVNGSLVLGLPKSGGGELRLFEFDVKGGVILDSDGFAVDMAINRRGDLNALLAPVGLEAAGDANFRLQINTTGEERAFPELGIGLAAGNYGHVRMDGAFRIGGFELQGMFLITARPGMVGIWSDANLTLQVGGRQLFKFRATGEMQVDERGMAAVIQLPMLENSASSFGFSLAGNFRLHVNLTGQTRQLAGETLEAAKYIRMVVDGTLSVGGFSWQGWFHFYADPGVLRVYSGGTLELAVGGRTVFRFGIEGSDMRIDSAGFAAVLKLGVQASGEFGFSLTGDFRLHVNLTGQSRQLAGETLEAANYVRVVVDGALSAGGFSWQSWFHFYAGPGVLKVYSGGSLQLSVGGKTVFRFGIIGSEMQIDSAGFAAVLHLRLEQTGSLGFSLTGSFHLDVNLTGQARTLAGVNLIAGNYARITVNGKLVVGGFAMEGWVAVYAGTDHFGLRAGGRIVLAVPGRKLAVLETSEVEMRIDSTGFAAVMHLNLVENLMGNLGLSVSGSFRFDVNLTGQARTLANVTLIAGNYSRISMNGSISAGGFAIDGWLNIYAGKDHFGIRAGGTMEARIGDRTVFRFGVGETDMQIDSAGFSAVSHLSLQSTGDVAFSISGSFRLQVNFTWQERQLAGVTLLAGHYAMIAASGSLRAGGFVFNGTFDLYAGSDRLNMYARVTCDLLGRTISLQTWFGIFSDGIAFRTGISASELGFGDFTLRGSFVLELNTSRSQHLFGVAPNSFALRVNDPRLNLPGVSLSGGQISVVFEGGGFTLWASNLSARVFGAIDVWMSGWINHRGEYDFSGRVWQDIGWGPARVWGHININLNHSRGITGSFSGTFKLWSSETSISGRLEYRDPVVVRVPRLTGWIRIDWVEEVVAPAGLFLKLNTHLSGKVWDGAIQFWGNAEVDVNLSRRDIQMSARLSSNIFGALRTTLHVEVDSFLDRVLIEGSIYGEVRTWFGGANATLKIRLGNFSDEYVKLEGRAWLNGFSDVGFSAGVRSNGDVHVRVKGLFGVTVGRTFNLGSFARAFRSDLSGFTAFFDANLNGRHDEGEPITVADENGGFAFVSDGTEETVPDFEPLGILKSFDLDGNGELDDFDAAQFVVSGGTVMEDGVSYQGPPVALPALNISANLPVSGATVFYDLNANHVLDPGEPSVVSDPAGRYSFLDDDASVALGLLASFDTNRNGELDNHEGVMIAIGGPNAGVLENLRLSDDAPEGATQIFYDANFNGRLDPAEVSVNVTSSGAYSFGAASLNSGLGALAPFDRNENGRIDLDEGLIVIEGGTDKNTGLQLEGSQRFLAVNYGTSEPVSLNPASAVLTEMMLQGLGQETATQLIRSAFNLAESFDPARSNPRSADDIESGDADAALLLFAQINSLVEIGAAALNAQLANAGRTGDSRLALTAELAEKIAATSGAVNLSDSGTIRELLDGAADRLGMSSSESDALAVVISTINRRVAEVVANTSGDTATALAGLKGVTNTFASQAAAELINGGITAETFVADFTGPGLDAKLAQFLLPPFISEIENVTGFNNLSVPFRIEDPDTDVAALQISVTSSSPDLLPSEAITISGSGTDRVLQLTPLPGLNGSTTITVTVSDGVRQTSESFVLDVNIPNTRPTVSEIADQSVFGGEPLPVVNFDVGDAETNATELNISIESDNSALFPNGSWTLGGAGADRTLMLQPASGEIGQATIAVSVSDGADVTRESFLVNVAAPNAAPTVAGSGTATLTRNETTTFVLTVGDAENGAGAVVLSFESNNTDLLPAANIVVSGTESERTVQITPVADAFGEAAITVSASDGVRTATHAVVVTVEKGKSAPTISAIGDQVILENNSTGLLAFTISDEDTGLDVLEVNVSSDNTDLIAADGLVLGGTGAERSITVTPKAGQTGVATVTVRVSDGELSAEETFSVAVLSANSPPSIVSSAITSVLAGKAYLYGLIGQDADTGDSVSFSLNAGPEWLALTDAGDGTATLAGTAPSDAPGDVTVRVIATDKLGAETSQEFSIAITPNAPPQISVIEDQVVLEDFVTSAIAFTISDDATDVGELEVSVASDRADLVPASAIQLDGSGSERQLVITPVAQMNGETTITVTVREGSISGSRTFKLTVVPVNDRPTLDAIADLSPILEDAALQQLVIEGIGTGDADADQSLTITAVSSNPSLVPNPAVVHTPGQSSAQLTYQPVANQNGTATITVRIQDNGGTENGGIDAIERTFTVTVTAVNDAPTLSVASGSITVLEDSGTFVLELSGIGDGDSEVSQGVTISFTNTNGSLLTNVQLDYVAGSENGTLRFTPAADASGTALIFLRIDDDGGTANGGQNSRFVPVAITVRAVNDAPRFDGISSQFMAANARDYRIALTGVEDGDLESDQQLEFSIESDHPSLLHSVIVIPTSDPSRYELLITPASDSTGNAIVTVRLRDSGGVLDGGADSVIRTFDLNVLPEVSIGSARVVEGHSGRQIVELPVMLSAPGQWVVRAALEVSPAISEGGDFKLLAGDVVFEPGETRQLVPVEVFGDDIKEGDQKWMVFITNVSGGLLGASPGFVTVVDDDSSIGPISNVSARPGELVTVPFRMPDASQLSAPAVFAMAADDSRAIVSGSLEVRVNGTEAEATFRTGENFGGTTTVTLSMESGSDAAMASFQLTTPVRALNWSSMAEHGAGVGRVGLAIGDDGAFSESRGSGLRELEIQFSGPVDPSTFTPANVVRTALEGSPETIANMAALGVSTSLKNDNTIGVISFDGPLPGMVPVLVAFSGVKGANGEPLFGDVDRVVTSLPGDASGDFRINNTDVGGVKFFAGPAPIEASNIWLVRSDVNLDGRVDELDVAWVKERRP